MVLAVVCFIPGAILLIASFFAFLAIKEPLVR